MKTAIFACNEEMPAATYLNGVPEAASNGQVLEGRMTVPYGMWPVTITNEKGVRERVIQRLDKAVAERLAATFDSLRGRFARLVGGSNIWLGHPDHATAGAQNEQAPGSKVSWHRLGRTVKLSPGETELIADGDFTEAAKALIAANQLAPSPYWGLRRTGEHVATGESIVEPVALFSFGMVPNPNIAGAAVNEEIASGETPAEVDPNDAVLNEEAQRERQSAFLVAELNRLTLERDAARADLAAAAQARDEALAQVAALTKALGDSNIRVTELERAAVAARAKQDEAISASRRFEQTAAANAQSSDALVAAVVAAAANAGLIVQADGDHWRERVRTMPAAINELVCPERLLKTSPIVAAARLAAANEALGGVSAAQRFGQAVREHMSRTGQNWPDAWNACKAAHRELFNLMPNGGKA